MEHLCINLCAETMQHFFNTHIFKSSIESCREEGIQCELEPDYVDNVPCIDLISSLVSFPCAAPFVPLPFWNVSRVAAMAAQNRWQSLGSAKF